MSKLICFIAVFTLLVGCDRTPQEAPTVIGIPFAVPISAIKQHLPEPAKAEQYPFIGMYGYELRYENPENWDVIVQDEAPDELAESRIWAIYLGRKLGRACARSDTEAVVNELQKKYAVAFSTTTVKKLEKEEAVALLAVDERRMLSAIAFCPFGNLSVRLSYFDLDRYQYRKPEEIQALLKRSATEAKEYKTRVLK